MHTCTETEVAKKWKYLRFQLADEIRREKATKSGMSTDDVYVSRWKWRSMLKFLEEKICTRPVAALTNLDFLVCMLIFPVFNLLLPIGLRAVQVAGI